MPDFLALDWENDQLCGLEAHVSGDRVRVKNCLCLRFPEQMDASQEPGQVGRWLKEELARAGVTARQVLIALPREKAVVRQLELPHTPDDELADLVRYQAAAKSSMSLDQLLLDFLPLPSRGDRDGRDVLMATISTETANRMREITDAAELELVSIGISSVATAELVARVESRRRDDSSGMSLVIAQHGHRVEISMLRNRHLLLTHSMLLAGADEQRDIQSILSEISRFRVALERQHVDVQIARAWVVGTEQETGNLCQALHERLSCTVRPLDPLVDTDVGFPGGDAPGSRALYAGPVGMLLSRAEPTVGGIDFLNPRRAPAKTERWKVQTGLIAAGVLLIAAVSYGGLKLHLYNLGDKIGNMQDDLQELDIKVSRGEPTLKSAALIDGWVAGGVNWLDKMRDANGVSPGTDRVYFTDLHFSTATGNAAGRISGTGYARERPDVDDLNQRLDDRGFRVKPPQIDTSRKDAKYPYRFELDIELASPKE